MQIINMNDSYFIKQTDTASEIHLKILGYEGEPISLEGKRVEVVIGNAIGRLLVKEPTILSEVGELKFNLDIGEVLPSGKQNLEVHIYEPNEEKVVAPSKGFYQLRVEQSIDEIDAEVNTVTLDYFTGEIQKLSASTSVQASRAELAADSANLAASEAAEKAALVEEAIQDTEQAKQAAIEAASYVDEKKPLIEKFTGEQENLQAQVDTLIINGDSSPAAAQAAINTEGVNKSTLKARLDDDYTKVTQQLAETANQLNLDS